VENYLDPDKKYFSYVLTRDECRYINSLYIKYIQDLGRVSERVMAIDDRVQSFGFNLQNIVPIKPWSHHDSLDNELLIRLDIVNGFYKSGFENVQEYLDQIFALNEFVCKSLKY
jgi:TFIIF-interacting CTD phosphatase-like protein